MAYYPWARYPPYSYDDTWLRSQPVGTPLAPNSRQLYYEDDYWMVPRHGPGWAGMGPGFAPYPPSPTMVAAMVPLPPSPYGTPRVSPRLGYVALPGPVGIPQYLTADPFHTPPAYVHPSYATPRSQVHPLLNGESQRFDLIFDLSASSIRPLTPAHSTSLSAPPPVPVHSGYLEQTATYPPSNHIRITCSALSPFDSESDWEIKVDPGHHVTIGDVLKAIHSSLQTQISHVEWARLSERRSFEVSAAYTRRCRSADSFASSSEFERNQGVRRVDLLGEKYFFAGLMRKKTDDLVHFKLLVKSKP